MLTNDIVSFEQPGPDVVYTLIYIRKHKFIAYILHLFQSKP